VSLISALIGRPFVREFAEAGQPKEVVESEPFARITSLLTWIWIAVFGGMTVSSAIPPIVQGDATLLDTRTPLSFVCYWVVPFALLGVAALLTRVLPDRMTPPAEELVRKTTFVAFAEAEIDQLIYLATEHANREVGAGKEAYDVRIGSKGIPLVGDKTRESWPSTYKVRERKSADTEICRRPRATALMPEFASSAFRVQGRYHDPLPANSRRVPGISRYCEFPPGILIWQLIARRECPDPQA